VVADDGLVGAVQPLVELASIVHDGPR
jgi:hypothetical protein